MKISVLILCSLVALNCLNLSAFRNKVEKYSNNLQSHCESQFSPHQKSKNLSAAFICGTNILNFEQQRAFQSSGLIHLIVVSGGHLKMLSLFLVNILSLLLLSKKNVHIVVLWLLIPYCLMTGFQAPLLRAFTIMILAIIAKFLRLNLSVNLISAFSGLLLVVIFPDWIFNFSFYLSWLASLGFCFPIDIDKKPLFFDIVNFVFSCLLIQFFISLVCQSFSLTSFFANIIIAPILSVALWPISLAGLISNKLIPLADYSWEFIVSALNKILANFEPSQSLQLSDFDWFFAWSLVAILHCLFFYIHTNQRKKCYV